MRIRRTTSAAMLRDVERTHPRRARPDGSSVPSETYVDPMAFLTEPSLLPAADRATGGRCLWIT